MREYQWDDGFWLTDGHCWCLLHDIPKLPREDTGDRVVLKPPVWVNFRGINEMAPVECTVYFVPKVNLYIAIGTIERADLKVLFFDKITLEQAYDRRWAKDTENAGKGEQ